MPAYALRTRGGGCAGSKVEGEASTELFEKQSPPAEKKRKPYAAFISHYKAESAMEARYLQTELERELGGRKCFIDSDDLSNLTSLTQNVIDSDVVVLVQSQGVLERP